MRFCGVCRGKKRGRRAPAGRLRGAGNGYKRRTPGRKRPWSGRRARTGAQDRAAEHAGAVCQRAVQHRGSHVHRAHRGHWRAGAGGRGRVRTGGDDDRFGGVAGRRRRRAADEHPHGRGRCARCARGARELFPAHLSVCGGADGAGDSPAPPDADAVRRECGHAAVRRRILPLLHDRHGVRAAGDGHELVRRRAGICEKGDDFGGARRSDEHRAGSAVHLRAGHGRSRRRDRHGAVAGGELRLRAGVPVRAARAGADHLWWLPASHCAARAGARIYAVFHRRRG